MPQIYCALQDCENYKDGLCSAAAIRIDPNEGCLTYIPFESGHAENMAEQGDQLTWDEEYFEYEFLDDDDITV